MGKVQAGHADFVGRETVEHESVVRVWAVGHGNFADGSGNSCHKRSFRRNTACRVLVARGAVSPTFKAMACQACGESLLFQRAANPAANKILITSAKTNQ